MTQKHRIAVMAVGRIPFIAAVKDIPDNGSTTHNPRISSTHRSKASAIPKMQRRGRESLASAPRLPGFKGLLMQGIRAALNLPQRG